MTVRVPGQSIDGMQVAAGEFAGLIERELRSTMKDVTSSLGGAVTAAAADRVSPDDVNAFTTLWVRIVDDVLMEQVEAQYEAAALAQINDTLAALRPLLTAEQLDQVRVRLSGQVITEDLLGSARNRLVGLGDEVWATSRDQLVEALEQGEGIDDMVDRLTSVVDDLGETRAERVARTETISVRNAASLDVMEQVGVTTSKQWQAALDERTRETHAAADGQTVPKNEPFSVGGSALNAPGDPAGPPEEIINCRCTMTFTFEEEELLALLDPDNPINQPLAAAANVHIHDGAMIALVPTAEDAERLAIADMEPVEELHLTLLFLGEASELPSDAADAIAAQLEEWASNQPPIVGHAFAVDWFNPAGDEPAWVLGIGGDELPPAHMLAVEAAQETESWTAPDQHQPWVAHVTLAYSNDTGLIEAMRERVGEITFDRLRLAVGDEVRDFPLSGGGDDTMQAAALEGADMAEGDALLEGVAIVEGVPTGDGRMWAEGSLTWPDPAETIIPLQWQKETSHGGMNDVTVNVGRLTSLERVGAEIRFQARVDTGSEDGAEVWRRYQGGFAGTVSIVGDDPDDPFGADIEFVFPEGCSDDPFGEEELDMACLMPERMIFHSTRIRALTLVDVPAFVEGIADDPAPETEEPMIAAGHVVEIPDRPPLDWFREPMERPEIGTITVTDEGRLYGYVAPKNVAHRAYADKLVTVPMGNVDYSTWMNRPTIVNGGERIATGVITMDCGHASPMAWVGAAQSTDHYDNSCAVAATARVGENDHGVWIAGALAPGVTGPQVARMMACQLSGDWRPHRKRPGFREFTAALVVPVPAFTAASMKVEDHVLVASAVPVRLVSNRPLLASVIGATDLPVADDREHDWDGPAAARRVFDLCAEGDSVDVDCVSRAFLWRNEDADPTTMGAYSLGFADVIDGRLTIVPRGVAAAAGGRGVDAADIPAADKDRIKSRICSLYDTIRDKFDDWPDCPFDDNSASAQTRREANSHYAETLMEGAGLGRSERAARLMEGVR